jgi:hypothetical protein
LQQQGFDYCYDKRLYDRLREGHARFAWENSTTGRSIGVVNFSDHQSQAKLLLPFASPGHEMYRFQDLLGHTGYDRTGPELTANGLYMDLPAWGARVFSMTSLQ